MALGVGRYRERDREDIRGKTEPSPSSSSLSPLSLYLPPMSLNSDTTGRKMKLTLRKSRCRKLSLHQAAYALPKYWKSYEAYEIPREILSSSGSQTRIGLHHQVHHDECDENPKGSEIRLAGKHRISDRTTGNFHSKFQPNPTTNSRSDITTMLDRMSP